MNVPSGSARMTMSPRGFADAALQRVAVALAALLHDPRARLPRFRRRAVA